MVAQFRDVESYDDIADPYTAPDVSRAIERLMADSAGHYSAATQSVYDYAVSATASVDEYDELAAYCNGRCEAAKLQLLQRLIRRGLNATEAAIARLDSASSNFNEIARKAETLKSAVGLGANSLQGSLDSAIGHARHTIDKGICSSSSSRRRRARRAMRRLVRLNSIASELADFVGDIKRVTRQFAAYTERFKARLRDLSADVRDVKIAVEVLETYATDEDGTIDVPTGMSSAIDGQLRDLKKKCADFEKKWINERNKQRR